MNVFNAERGLQRLINSIFKLAQLPLPLLIIHALAMRAKTVNVAFNTKNPAFGN